MEKNHILVFVVLMDHSGEDQDEDRFHLQWMCVIDSCASSAKDYVRYFDFD